MILISKLKNEDEKVIAEDCTIGQAFTMIDNWCTDNNATHNWHSAFKDKNDTEFTISCYDLDTFDTVIIFIIDIA